MKTNESEIMKTKIWTTAVCTQKNKRRRKAKCRYENNPASPKLTSKITKWIHNEGSKKYKIIDS